MAAAAQNYAAGIKAGSHTPQWAPASWQGSAWPTLDVSPNVVWRDVTSNATYCSVANVLDTP